MELETTEMIFQPSVAIQSAGNSILAYDLWAAIWSGSFTCGPAVFPAREDAGMIALIADALNINSRPADTTPTN